MGWPWSSPSSSDASQSVGNPPESGRGRFALSDEQRSRIFGQSGPLQAHDRARDAQADKELEAFLTTLSESEKAKATNASPTVAQPSQEPAPVEPTNHDRILPDGTLDISPEALYPRTMSCRQAFDQAFYCQSLGGKFNDIYRFGHLQSCSEQWGSFWFCMRTRTLPAAEREKQIKEHYQSKEERKRKEWGSSENIWEMRKKGVTQAFGRDPRIGEDEDW